MITNDLRSKLHQNLADNFSEEELRTLCFDMGVDYENLPAEGKAGKARELIIYLERVGRTAELVEQCRELRSGISWEDTPETSRVTFVSPLVMTPEIPVALEKETRMMSKPELGSQSNLLVTVTDVEARAVLDLYKEKYGTEIRRQPIGDKTYYNLGIIGEVQTYMVQSEMGIATPGGALLTIHKAIESLKPAAIIMIGIAFGTRPDKQKLGDILVAKQIQSYEPQKVKGLGKIVPRGDRVTCSTRLLDRFRSGGLDWKDVPVHFGLVLSGEKLIADQSDARQAVQAGTRSHRRRDGRRGAVRGGRGRQDRLDPGQGDLRLGGWQEG